MIKIMVNKKKNNNDQNNDQKIRLSKAILMQLVQKIRLFFNLGSTNRFFLDLGSTNQTF